MKIFNYKKSIIAVMVISILSSLAGCKKDFLNRETQGAYNQDNYPYPQGSGPYDQFINGAYSVLRSFNVTVWPFVGIVSIRSDDADKGSTPADSGDQIQMDALSITPSNGLVDAFWTGHYDLINKCNFVLERVANDPNPNTPENLKIAAQAEARFLRGYAYFMLVRSYGRVPLVDTVITKSAAEANIPQSQPAAIYQFIENDLNFAAANLPASYDAKFVGKVTSGAANGLLAKVYLYQQKWAQAMDAANKVMTSGQYDLSTPYAQIFNESGENSKESVFEVQATATPSNPTAYGCQYSNVQGVRGTGQWDLGWGFNVPSTALESAFEPNDPRKARTILYAGGTSIFGEAIPAGLPNPRYNNKVYTDPARRAQIGNRFGFWNNVRLLRYADVVLMYAEAANELGGATNTTNALAALNSVRARARGGDNTILPDVTTTDQATLRDAIRHERRVELGMEHERFFDIVRWGIAADVLQQQGKTFIVGKNELLPIPQNQIDLSKGTLTQNPGY
ncbi:MAG: RagB/SusD family nutrient uptake outer membrane protein [Sphingobacteriales bacterium]|nr:RagB/SusD family nutrient uptake outer membrane protein [Sphingobacteriales bacterium]